MRSTFKQLYYINRSKVKADGTTAIWCRISIDGKQVVLSTGIYCNPDDWNTKKGEVKDVRTNVRLSQYRQHRRYIQHHTEGTRCSQCGTVEKYHSGGKFLAHNPVGNRQTRTGEVKETLCSDTITLHLPAIRYLSRLYQTVHRISL